jgi:hypothetical protein
VWAAVPVGNDVARQRRASVSGAPDSSPCSQGLTVGMKDRDRKKYEEKNNQLTCGF